MGTGLSSNYTNIVSAFNFGIWKVSKAIHKGTNRPVCLWSVNYKKIKEMERNKKNRRNYIQFLYQRIQKQQTIHHINVLKIIEVKCITKKVGFASEPIDFSLCGEKKYSNDEFLYIAQQLAVALKDLHEKFHIAFLGVYPEQIFINGFFVLKLGMFIHCCSFENEMSSIHIPFLPWAPNSVYHIPPCWCAPEIVKSAEITSRCDVFMYALTCFYVYSGKLPKQGNKVDEAWVNEVLSSMPKDFNSLFRKCLTAFPNNRPNFDEITHDSAFSSLTCNIFLYFENIIGKGEKDLFVFFSGLKKAISNFSDRIIKKKFMPMFIFFIKKDSRFSLALYPLVFMLIQRYDIKEYVAQILSSIKPDLLKIDNPAVSNLALDYIGMLLHRLPPEFYEDFVYSIVISNLNSPDVSVLRHCLDILPYIVKCMSINYIKVNLVTSLLKTFENNSNYLNQSNDALFDILHDIIILMTLIMTKTGTDFIAQEVFPVIKKVWEKVQNPKLAEPISILIETCNIPCDLTLLTTSQLALSLLSNPQVPKTVQSRMILFIQNLLHEVQNERHISQTDFENSQAFNITPMSFPTDTLPDILGEMPNPQEIKQSNSQPLPKAPPIIQPSNNQDNHESKENENYECYNNYYYPDSPYSQDIQNPYRDLPQNQGSDNLFF